MGLQHEFREVLLMIESPSDVALIFTRESSTGYTRRSEQQGRLQAQQTANVESNFYFIRYAGTLQLSLLPHFIQLRLTLNLHQNLLLNRYSDKERSLRSAIHSLSMPYLLCDTSETGRRIRPCVLSLKRGDGYYRV